MIAGGTVFVPYFQVMTPALIIRSPFELDDTTSKEVGP